LQQNHPPQKCSLSWRGGGAPSPPAPGSNCPLLTDAIQKRKNLVIKRKTKAFNSAKYHIIKTQAVGS